MNKTSPQNRVGELVSRVATRYSIKWEVFNKNSELLKEIEKFNTCMKKKTGNKNYLGNEPDVSFYKKFKVSV